MTYYRDMIIEPLYPTGYSWGFECDEYAKGSEKTIKACKRAIDDYYAEQTVYFVSNPVSKTITKFFSLIESIDFCKRCAIGFHNIRFQVAGYDHEFDSI